MYTVTKDEHLQQKAAIKTYKWDTQVQTGGTKNISFIFRILVVNFNFT